MKYCNCFGNSSKSHIDLKRTQVIARKSSKRNLKRSSKFTSPFIVKLQPQTFLKKALRRCFPMTFPKPFRAATWKKKLVKAKMKSHFVNFIKKINFYTDTLTKVFSCRFWKKVICTTFTASVQVPLKWYQRKWTMSKKLLPE